MDSDKLRKFTEAVETRKKLWKVGESCEKHIRNELIWLRLAIDNTLKAHWLRQHKSGNSF